MSFTKFIPLLVIIVIFAIFPILKRYNERRHTQYTYTVREIDKNRDLSAKYGILANAKLRFAPPPELNLLPKKLRKVSHATFGPLKMEMPMQKGYRIAQIGGFLVFVLALCAFIYVWYNPGPLLDEAALVGLGFLMLVGLVVGIGFFWGREKLRFYEHGMVYRRGKIQVYPYADIEHISLEKRPMYYRGSSAIIGYKLAAIIQFNNSPPLELTGQKLAGFPDKLILWQQYLTWS